MGLNFDKQIIISHVLVLVVLGVLGVLAVLVVRI
jgi:hypothetical protein